MFYLSKLWKRFLLKIRTFVYDFPIDLLKIDVENKIEEYYIIMSTNFLMPHITLHTRITSESSTLTDNIYPNNLDISYAVSGNLTVSISDHLPKDNMKNAKRQHLFRREMNFDKESLVADIININWDSVLSLDQVNIRNANIHQCLLMVKLPMITLK